MKTEKEEEYEEEKKEEDEEGDGCSRGEREGGWTCNVCLVRLCVRMNLYHACMALHCMR